LKKTVTHVPADNKLAHCQRLNNGPGTLKVDAKNLNVFNFDPETVKQ
jgi:hypothetical protein